MGKVQHTRRLTKEQERNQESYGAPPARPMDLDPRFHLAKRKPGEDTCGGNRTHPQGPAGSPFRRHNARAQCGKEPEGVERNPVAVELIHDEGEVARMMKR